MGERPTRPPGGVLLSNAKCAATRLDGQACGALPGLSVYCFWHDPGRREEMLEASRKGGSRATLSLPVGRLLEAHEARGLLSSVLVALLEGALDVNTCRATAYLIQTERRIAEGEALEKRVASLEELLKNASTGYGTTR